MKELYIIVLIVLFFTGLVFAVSYIENRRVSMADMSKALECTTIQNHINRCENSEAICYLGKGNSWGSCKFKEGE